MITPPKIRRYEGQAATVTYDATRCIHSGECVHGLPSVFDSKAKPWVNPDGASADHVSATVERCPSGALQVERRDGRTKAIAAINTATLTANGPTYLRGDLALMGADNMVLLGDTRMAVCRCGASQNKPLCDGSHVKLGFVDDGALRAAEKPAVAAAGGRVEIRARPNGPLMLKGPLIIVGTNGRTAFEETSFLCRCGASRNKPYCDGSHTKIGFVG